MASNVAADASFLEHHTPVLELHRSNVLRLETEELLKECRLDFQHVKWHSAALGYIATLNTVLQGLPRHVPAKKDCPLPLLSDRPPTSPLLLGETPLHVTLSTNSTVLGMTTKTGNAKELPLLECTIALPDSLVSSKDYLHHRYFTVRRM